ncbi:STAS/SEC14 domain-containing protein [Flavobacterium sp. TAB 87]|uniref:STAS/SEC14 domain-containing protein n=1 Tax=Flavobacterium sp. TAB 87 TaxID=1729581 RepID=UPI00076CE065|nr:STAS/SEC14 domain-containing protein [Flavobacterium sp. TAB 87]KVV15536.1 hypothetical protein AP058_00820 [Flavobacterium sp. TAB 87]
MITLINEAPKNIPAFKATGAVTKENYQTVVIPAIERLIARTDQINFLLYLDTDIAHFTAGAWFEDAMLGLKNLGKWHRAAIVIDSSTIISFTNAFSYIMPGEFKGFAKEKYDDAILWVSQ